MFFKCDNFMVELLFKVNVNNSIYLLWVKCFVLKVTVFQTSEKCAASKNRWNLKAIYCVSGASTNDALIISKKSNRKLPKAQTYFELLLVHSSNHLMWNRSKSEASPLQLLPNKMKKTNRPRSKNKYLAVLSHNANKTRW